MSSRMYLLPMLLLVGCPSALSPPEAVIATGSSSEAEHRDELCEDPPRLLDVQVGQPAPIHAGCSRDGNALGLRHKWRIVDQPNGSKIEIVNDETISPTIVPDMAGRYRVGLVVSNGTLNSEQASITLEAQ